MSLGPITIEESTKLIALVHAARKIIDLGVIPVRTWLVTARCDDHKPTVEEHTLPMAEQPPSILKCALCAISFGRNSWKSAVAVVIRG
jgi:hypothetical protein